MWTGYICLRRGGVLGYCEHSKELSGSIQGREFLDELNDYYILKKASAPWSQLIYQGFSYYVKLL